MGKEKELPRKYSKKKKKKKIGCMMFARAQAYKFTCGCKCVYAAACRGRTWRFTS